MRKHKHDKQHPSELIRVIWDHQRKKQFELMAYEYRRAGYVCKRICNGRHEAFLATGPRRGGGRVCIAMTGDPEAGTIRVHLSDPETGAVLEDQTWLANELIPSMWENFEYIIHQRRHQQWPK